VGGGRSGKHDVHELTVKVRSGETVNAPETSANVLRCAATASQKEEKKEGGQEEGEKEEEEKRRGKGGRKR
jgi:ribosomal protein L12E/L44/L45/RPP1/RPP2